MASILLGEDDNYNGHVLSEYMRLKSYKVTWKETVSEALDVLSEATFDLVVLDINLKNESGYEVAQVMRKEMPTIPFIFLTARDLKIDQLKGYQLGAEEYITKPIDEEILLAKIDAILARKKEATVILDELSWKNIVLDTNKRELKAGEKVFQLTERECLLMKALISQPEELVKRKTMLMNIWESQDEFSRNSMDVYISRLRKYLSNSEASIRNVHGKGFVLE